MRIRMPGFLPLAVVCLAGGTLSAASDPFVGKWKVNPSQSKLTDEMKVEAVGENKYAFTFGPGAVDTVVVDGTDQPALQGTTLAVTAEGPNNWRVVRKKDGKKIVMGVWTLSADGNTLDDAFTVYRPDGSTANVHYKYQRTAGTSGFPGTWDSVSAEIDASIGLEIRPSGDNGLLLISPLVGGTQNVTFDGKDYQRVNERSLEITNKRDGRVRDIRQFEVSEDLKTLTVSIRAAGESKPQNILVFDREP